MARSAILCKIMTPFVFIILFFLTGHVEAHRLNVPRVLLPVFNDFAVNFTLEVTDGGCYQWSTSRLDIIQLIPMNENLERTCSSAIIIQTITRESTRNTAIVLAEDVNTGQFLRCDVIVDAIFSLSLITTTRELYIEEAPEAFEVRAYDEQGNEFTTLAGVEFTWHIDHADKRGQSNGKLPGNVLRFMTYQESQYETPVTVGALDAVGKKGHIVLLEGSRTGTAKVSVRLPYSEYKHVPSIEVELIVIANLIIIPSDVTMMAFDSLKYRIMQAQQGRLEEIYLPSSQYYLEAENSDILRIDNEHGSAYALGLGRTKVFLHDKNVRDEYPVILPSATVNVNTVAYISIAVLPNRNWGLILGHTHEIVVELFDSKDHKFHIGEGVEVSVKLDETYIDPKMITQNGTYVMGVPIACGSTTVEAVLHGIIDAEGNKISLPSHPSTRAELLIHTPVIVQPRMLAVPWDSKSKSRYDIALKANGGDGSYAWATRHPSIVTVSQNGGVRILSAGSAEITVSMARNQYNRDIAKIYILPPSKLRIIEYNMEAAVGESIHLHIALYGKLVNGTDAKEVAFNECKDVNFELFMPDGNFVRNDSKDVQPVGIACAVLTITSLGGTSEVTVAYNVDGQYLTDNVTVSAYEPLEAIHPESKETLLAVGSSRKIVFRGGPQPWTTKPQGYSKKMQVSDEDIVEVLKVDHFSRDLSDLSVFEVICKSLGEAVLSYTVSNIPLLPNCRNTYATETVRVTCGKPRYIYFQPEFKDSKNCPISQNTERVMAQSDKNLKIIVSMKDEDGRRFDNITSLNIEWHLKPSVSGTVEIAGGTIEETFTDMNVALPKNHYQKIIFKKHYGTLVICATVTGYQKYVLGKLQIIPEWPPFPVETQRGTLETPLIEASIEVVLVNDTSIAPAKLMVLNDPAGKYYLQVNQGSGYYEFMLSSDDIADVRYMEPMKAISVMPKKSGVLNIALVDLCLSSKPAEAIIEVQELSVVEVETISKIEKGKCVLAALKLYDTNGQIIKLPSLNALDFKGEIDNDYVETKQLSASEHGNPPYDKLLFMIYGIQEGESQLTFVNKGFDREIRSESVNIQVFLPLKVHPNNLTVLIGTVYQVQTSGGPSNAQIEFSTKNNDVLSVDRHGIFEGKSTGQTQIVVRAVGFNAKGNKVVYSESHADIHVLYLEGIKIAVPTAKVKVGAAFPLWAFGIPEYLTPLVIGSMQLPLAFMWSSSDSNLLSLHNMYEGTGINIRYQNEVSLRAKALNPGLATIYLNVTMPCNRLAGFKNDVTYTTFVKVEIFEELRLIKPGLSPTVPTILMSPNSLLKLQTNRDKQGMTSYKILSTAHGNESGDSHALSPASKSVTIDRNGVIRTGDSLGKTIISITNTETFNLKQSLSVVVEVKPVHYMMLALESNLRIRSGEELSMLPKGMELNYVLEYYDNVGTKFHAAETNYKTTTNRADLAVFNKNAGNTITAKFFDNGELVLKVFNEKHPNGMFDYVHMMIGEILFPTKTTLTVGDIVCFSMPLLSSDGDPGYWQTSASDVLTVDPITGIARARSVGHAVIKHSLAVNMQGEIEVDIQPISKVSIVPLRGKNITGTETFSVPLVLKSKDEQVKENNVLARGLGGCRTYSSFSLTSFPYTCDIQFVSSTSTVGIKDLFLVKPRFDIVSGFYYCDIIPMGSPTVASSTLETRIQISAQSRDVEATPLEVSYLPPAYISTKEIVFVNSPSHTVLTATLDIHGLQPVLEHFTIDVPEGITVSGRQYISKFIIQYKLRLMHNQDNIQGQKVNIANELTKQNVSLFVRVTTYDQYITLSGVPWVDFMYFHRYSFGSFAVIVITCFFIWKNKMASMDMTIKNRDVFADKCPPPLRKTTSPCPPSMNNTFNLSSSRSPNTSCRQFSAFEPIYGDPRGFYTPTATRNRSMNTP